MEDLEMQLKIAQISTTLERILDHHEGYKQFAKDIRDSLEAIKESQVKETISRMEEDKRIEQKIDDKAGKIIWSVLVMCVMIIGSLIGVIYWSEAARGAKNDSDVAIGFNSHYIDSFLGVKGAENHEETYQIY